MAESPEAKLEEKQAMPDPENLVAECRALALYVSRHGGSLLSDTVDLRSQLFETIAKFESEPSRENWSELMTAYANLSAVTYKEYGVNGRTVLDTLKVGNSCLSNYKSLSNRPIYFGVVLFILILVCESAVRWFGQISDTAALNPYYKFSHLVVTELSSLVLPALWGGLGSCIFLAKRISDKLFDLAYEESRLRGDFTRIFLGAILGVVAVVLVFPDFEERVMIGDTTFGPPLVAFIAGLGVKPIYAAFETLSEELANRFSGKSNK